MRGDFVVQIKPEIDLERGQFQGRVEHIDSGCSAQFRTVEDLIAFILRATSKPAAKNLTAL